MLGCGRGRPKTGQGDRDGIRESISWTGGYQRVAEYAGELPTTRLVYVADCESDILELMQTAQVWIVRPIG